MNEDYAVIVSSKAEDFTSLFPGKKCFNLMEIDINKIEQENILFIERDFFTEFDFSYFLSFPLGDLNIGLNMSIDKNWDFSFNSDYTISDTEIDFKENFTFSGVAFLKKEFFVRDLGPEFMLDNSKVVRTIPVPARNFCQEKAIFLDRDGVLIEDCGYPYKDEHLKLNDDIFNLLNWAMKESYKLIILTNQAGIAREKFTLEQYQNFTNNMIKQFNSKGIVFDGIYCCPYHKEGRAEYKGNSFLRKPWPGMLIKAIEDHGIDVTKSFMVGDKDSDRLLAPLKKSFILQGNYEISQGDTCSLADIPAQIKKLES